jgi:hypothetical protein
VTCEEARLLIGAVPGASTAVLEEHLRTCADCTRFREEMRALDGEIRVALERAPETTVRAVVRGEPAWRRWALAAGVALATFAVLGVWVLRPTDTLARDVVAHVQAEPDSWFAAEHVSAEGIGAALRGAGVSLNITSDHIRYAHSCWFRGRYVPHLVVQTAQGPVTVLILRHEHTRAARGFSEAGMTGVIVPAENGSLAVVARGGEVDDIAAQVQREVRWQPDTH